ncbi:exosortase A [Paracraurococcus lichenis]|uniref:Exosortase n=1 Tax=Paracraurococcus lichenis TaxID=3064888 RepID=A0ABT9E6W7_9PROT|nr:exosortase A [Paracraurococcus sp. LOR1-02]MDO9711925.1 exosortase [Paracraurococcus sp. LOR1-02]
MSDSSTLDAPVAARPAASWPAALLLLGLGLAALGVLFAGEIVAAVRVWDASATYNHCWLVLPIAGWLAWTRRDRLIGLILQPMPQAALLALPAGLAWLAADRLGIMEGRQFAALGMVWILMLAVLGWRICRAMATALLYLVFLVPFGTFAVPTLQGITASLVGIGLQFTGVPHYIDSLVIETPAGNFLVAEACAGLRFLIATLAFGALYAFVMFRSPGRRLVVMALALAVPIIANGLRALGIVLLGQYFGSAEAAAADHILYGWIFFSIVLLLLILAGLPFRQDGAPETPRPLPIGLVPPRPMALAGAAALVVGLAAAGPTAGLVLQQSGARTPHRTALPLAMPAGCEPGPAEDLHCDGLIVTAQIVAFPARMTWSAVSAERSRLVGTEDTDILFTVRVPGSIWQARQSREAGTTVAVATWLNGRPAAGGLRSRAEQAWNSLGGGQGAPVLVVLTVRPEQPTLLDSPRQRQLLESLLLADGTAVATRAAALSANGSSMMQD